VSVGSPTNPSGSAGADAMSVTSGLGWPESTRPQDSPSGLGWPSGHDPSGHPVGSQSDAPSATASQGLGANG